jgi:RHS repeat-associated protein
METLLPIRRRASQYPRRANRSPRGTRPSCTLTARPCAASQKAATTPLTNHKKNHQPRFIRNQQYSITAVSDGGGSVVERYAYSAYGQVTFADASGSEISNSAIANRYIYTGREWDEGLSLYHFRARMYDAVCGRFCGRDPLKSIRNLIALYSGQFASKSALDPGGDDWVFPWNPNAQWWWPFSSLNPYEPRPEPPSGGGTSGGSGTSGGGGRGGMAPIYACAAGAILGATADQIERVMNGEAFDMLDGQAVAAAVTGCYWAGCGSIVLAGIATAPTVVGACVILGVGGTFCLFSGRALCHGVANIAGADVPWFCDFPPLFGGGGGGGGIGPGRPQVV